MRYIPKLKKIKYHNKIKIANIFVDRLSINKSYTPCFPTVKCQCVPLVQKCNSHVNNVPFRGSVSYVAICIGKSI